MIEAMLIWFAPFCGMKICGWQLEQSSHSVCCLCGYTTSGIEPFTSRTMLRSITTAAAVPSSLSQRGRIFPPSRDETQLTRLPALSGGMPASAVSGGWSACVPGFAGSWMPSSAGEALRLPGAARRRLNALGSAAAVAAGAARGATGGATGGTTTATGAAAATFGAGAGAAFAAAAAGAFAVAAGGAAPPTLATR